MGTYIPSGLRQEVYDRAGGRCEYCLVPETAVLVSHEVDHIIAQKHGGLTESGNLALSCTVCNKYKGTDLASLDPETGAVTPLFHPRRERWIDHFRLVGVEIVPLTATGRVTVRLLQLNHSDHIEDRNLLLAAGMLYPPA